MTARHASFDAHLGTRAAHKLGEIDGAASPVDGGAMPASGSRSAACTRDTRAQVGLKICGTRP